MTLWSFLRRLVATVLALLACALLPLAIGSAWMTSVVTDTDSWVEAVAPLPEEKVVREAIAVRVEQAAVVAVNVPERERSLARTIGRAQLRELREAGLSRPEAVAASVDDAVRRSVARVLDDESFPGAWREVNRDTHAQLITALDDRAGAGDVVRIDLAPVLASTLAVLAEEGLVEPDQARAAPVSFNLVSSARLDGARPVYERVDTTALWLPAACLAAAVLALAISPLRRRTGLVLAALSLVSVGLMALVLAGARSVFVTAVANDAQESDLLDALLDVLLASLWQTVVIALIVAGVALLALAFAPAVGRRVRGTTPEPADTLTPG